MLLARLDHRGLAHLILSLLRFFKVLAHLTSALANRIGPVSFVRIRIALIEIVLHDRLSLFVLRLLCNF